MTDGVDTFGEEINRTYQPIYKIVSTDCKNLFDKIHEDIYQIIKFEALAERIGEGRLEDYLDGLNKKGKSLEFFKYMFNLLVNDILEIKDKHGDALAFSLNVQPNDIAKKEFIDFIIEQVKEKLIKPEFITIEVLEDELDGNQEEFISNLEILKETGFKIAIDDFGKGHSNEERVEMLHNKGLLDYLKIDGIFLEERLKGSEYIDIEFIKKIYNDKVKIIFEHVNSDEDLDFTIKHFGKDVLFQGHKFNSKMSKEDVLLISSSHHNN